MLEPIVYGFQSLKKLYRNSINTGMMKTYIIENVALPQYQKDCQYLSVFGGKTLSLSSTYSAFDVGAMRSL